MSRFLPLRVLALVLALALVAAACGGDDTAETADETTETAEDTANSGDDEAADGESAIEDIATPTTVPTPLSAGGACAEPVADPAADPEAPAADPTDLSLKPAVELPATAPTELVVEDIVEGAGDTVASGDFVIMQYVGVSCSSGEQFDASWDRGQPFSVVLGQGAVIAGWDEGIVGMALGGRRLLVIPPDLAYGDTGSGSGSIPPGDTIAFVVDLIGFVPADHELPEATVPDAPVDELTTTDLVEGDGAEAGPESIVWVHYRGVTQSDGNEFDASLPRGIDQPLIAQLAPGQLIDGMIEGIAGMKVGGTREIVIPADLAYGEQGAGEGLIGPDETLVFVVSLHSVFQF
jgi:peptidylprolyl isomerase